MKKLLTAFFVFVMFSQQVYAKRIKNKESSQSSNIKVDIIKKIINEVDINDDIFKSLKEENKNQPTNVDTNSRGFTHYQVGTASYYGDKWNGRKTSNGEVFNTSLLTAAHKSLPFGTLVRVTNNSNGKSVIVRINDRGPFVKGRVIDLTRAAFQAIESVNKGLTRVKLEIIK